jgi:hypothetical protein
MRSNADTETQEVATGEAGQQALLKNSALKWLDTPADIANGVLLFAFDEAGWVSGSVADCD